MTADKLFNGHVGVGGEHQTLIVAEQIAKQLLVPAKISRRQDMHVFGIDRRIPNNIGGQPVELFNGFTAGKFRLHDMQPGQRAQAR